MRSPRFLAIGAVAAALVLGVATPAAAHSWLVGSNPEAGDTLTELPAEFSVTMNEPLLVGAGDAAFALQLRDAQGHYYGDGCLTIVDATMSTAAEIGAPGPYLLEWQVVSADGHPVGGTIAFIWEGEPTAQGSAHPADCDGDGPEAAAQGEHTNPAMDVHLVDVLWIVGAVLAVSIAITVALLATRRRPDAVAPTPEGEAPTASAPEEAEPTDTGA